MSNEARTARVATRCAGHGLAVAAGATLLGFSFSPIAQAEESARDFFQGKPLQFFTMGSPGGGYDAYTRAIGAWLEQKLGVRALIVNDPAAGGLVAMNRLLVARPDGL